jgi:hypothetical protein
MRARDCSLRQTLAALGLALIALSTGGRLAVAAEPPCDPAAPPRQGITYLCQGWSADKAEWWYHVSQGTAIMPYAWFMALEQPSGTEPFAAPDHLARFGFLADPSEGNADGLPVGFAQRKLDFPSTAPFKFHKGQWIGFACAACHTGQIRYNGAQIRIEGGAAHLDLEGFGHELKDAFAALGADSAKAGRFFQRIAAETDGSPQSLQKLKEDLQGFLKAFKDRDDLFDEGRKASPDEPVSGLGRLDAVQRGGNLIVAAPLGQEKNFAPNTAPVRYPALWDTPYFDWVLYDTSIRQPLARNVVEALGVGAPFDPATLLSGHIVHDVLLDNVVKVHLGLMELKSPRWPEYVLPPINSHRLARGEALYKENCASCHALITRETHAPVGAVTEDAVRIKVKTVPLAEIGTDPRQAATLAMRLVTLQTISGPRSIRYTDAVQIVTSGIVEQWAAQSPENEATMKKINAGRKNEIRGIFVYRARPLNGIWAMAPYLHNGSVPTLHALLLPPDQRPSKFYVGSYEFDPVNVGFESAKAVENGFLFDTTQPGNWNVGHEYGTQLSEMDRMALIEFLKTL